MIETFEVSVVVPVYNCANVLPRTISIITDYFAREFQDYELILIDDASRDNSVAVIRAAAAKNQKICAIMHEFNEGQQQTLAHGFLAAKCEIVISVDADLPCALTDLKRIACLAHGGIELVLGKRAKSLNAMWWRILGTKLTTMVFRALYPFEISDFGCGIAALRRSLVEKIRNMDRPVRLIKLDSLNLADNYIETEINTDSSYTAQKSSYSLLKLLKIFWKVLTYRFKQ